MSFEEPFRRIFSDVHLLAARTTEGEVLVRDTPSPCSSGDYLDGEDGLLDVQEESHSNTVSIPRLQFQLDAAECTDEFDQGGGGEPSWHFPQDNDADNTMILADEAFVAEDGEAPDSGPARLLNFDSPQMLGRMQSMVEEQTPPSNTKTPLAQPALILSALATTVQRRPVDVSPSQEPDISPAPTPPVPCFLPPGPLVHEISPLTAPTADAVTNAASEPNAVLDGRMSQTGRTLDHNMVTTGPNSVDSNDAELVLSTGASLPLSPSPASRSLQSSDTYRDEVVDNGAPLIETDVGNSERDQRIKKSMDAFFQLHTSRSKGAARRATILRGLTAFMCEPDSCSDVTDYDPFKLSMRNATFHQYYRNFVNRPFCLSELLTRTNSGKSADLLYRMRLIFLNAISFNTHNDVISDEACKMLHCIDSLKDLEEFAAKPVRILKAHASALPSQQTAAITPRAADIPVSVENVSSFTQISNAGAQKRKAGRPKKVPADSRHPRKSFLSPQPTMPPLKKKTFQSAKA